MADHDEFYVGYHERCPPALARRVRVVVVTLLSIGAAVCLALVASQARFDPGTFEYGVEREFTGVLVARPHPALVEPAARGGEVGVQLLVGIGKRGLADRVQGQDGRPVRVVGSAIDNGRARMIEVRRIAPLEGEAGLELLRRHWPATIELGRLTLSGEIVDSKCHLGVMKPGRGKPHKDCAIRCLSGGIPPLLRVESRAGAVDYFLLVATDGRAVGREILDFVAEPIEITGRVTRTGPLSVLYADPASYRRL
jgi:hypothetical protein